MNFKKSQVAHFNISKETNKGYEQKSKSFEAQACPSWNKKRKRRKRDQRGESGMKRAKWHLQEKGGEIKGDG